MLIETLLNVYTPSADRGKQVYLLRYNFINTFDIEIGALQ